MAVLGLLVGRDLDVRNHLAAHGMAFILPFTQTLRSDIRDGKLQAFELGLKDHISQRALDDSFHTPIQSGSERPPDFAGGIRLPYFQVRPVDKLPDSVGQPTLALDPDRFLSGAGPIGRLYSLGPGGPRAAHFK